ncbi:MAG: hypothetical protein IPL63_06315 [Saprospiraceae bacterium]|nr:hypothetical protein [Saprospiraceae bacterium]MBK8546995.1 hypothetical protein [Saprospiraceae bacterium]MBK8853417.1 hypothetical protein [Saprospiraceae bacterium]MBK9042001.1 hypothetical protein [Saprospiraceae bacterium]
MTDKKKKYTSFEEIQQEMEVLKMEREIAFLKIKKEVAQLKTNTSLSALATESMSIAEHEVKAYLTGKLEVSATKWILKRLTKLFKKKKNVVD